MVSATDKCPLTLLAMTRNCSGGRVNKPHVDSAPCPFALAPNPSVDRFQAGDTLQPCHAPGRRISGTSFENGPCHFPFRVSSPPCCLKCEQDWL
jgi:hypothetical protein